MTEIWNDIKGFDGLYQYNANLQIRSVSHYAKSKKGGRKWMKGRVLKPILAMSNGRKDYARVSLSKKGVKHMVFLHKFFAEMFIHNPDNKKYVNHKDGNKHNYNLINLEWASKSEDLQHAYNTGLKKQKKGTESPLYGTVGQSGWDSYSGKIVLNEETGIFYPTCYEAAIAYGIRAATLSIYLTGVRANKTNFVYV